MDDAVPLILIALAFLATPWVLGIVALVKLGRARRRIEALEAKAVSLERWLGALGGTAPSPSPSPSPTATATAPSAHSLADASGPPAAPTWTSGAPPPIPPTPTSTAQPPPSPEPLPTVAPPPPRPAAASASSLEEKIALVWFTRIGALAVLAGAGYFFKYAVDNDWIGPTGRVALGALAGLAAIAAGEALRPRTRALWVNAVQGAGIALLYLAAFAGAALYQLFPFPAAFAAVAVIALTGGALAVRGRSELVLALALAGGLLAPALLSTGEDRPGGLFGWLLALAVPALLVSARLRFLVVPWLTFAGTAVFFGAWYERFFAVWPPPAVLDPNLPAAAQAGAYHALAPRLVPLALALAHVGAWLFTWESFVRGPVRPPDPRRRPAPRLWADLWLTAALVVGELGAFSLLHDRPLGAGGIVAGAGILAALFAERAGRPSILLVVTALGGALVAVGIAGARPGTSPSWIAAAAGWGVVHLVAAARALLRTRESGAAPSTPLLLCAALAGLGFAALGLEATGPGDGLLRAVLAGVAGAAELSLGAAVLRRGRLRATILLGTSLALVAAATAFLLSGASVTLAWAALAAVVAVLAARDRAPVWLAGAGLLFAAALVRLVIVDVPAPQLARSLFLGGDGTAGALHPTFLLNARALALAGTAAALLVAARSVARPGQRWRLAAAALATTAHGCLLALAVTEAQGLALSIPAPPPTGDALAFEQYREAFGAEVWAQADKLDMVTTLVLGLYAALLVGVGFLAREVLHRWLGLALFAATLGKLLLHDVWRLARLYQVLVFLAVGVLMLAAAFLYARYGRRILGMLREPPRGPGMALLLAAAGLGIALPARALDASPYRTVRALTGVTGAGHHAVRVDADLWRASLASAFTLADLRIAGPGGEEVPWTLRQVGGPDGEEEVPAALVDPVVLPTGAVRAVIDKGRRGLRTDELRLELSGDDFLRPVRIESSGDGRSFGVLAEGGRVYAVKGLAGARRTVVRHPASEARFLRVTILPGAGDPPRLLDARPVRRSEAPPPMDGLDLGAPVRTAGPDGRTSLFDVDLGGAGIPASAVVLSVATPAFERPVRVLGSSDGSTYVALGAGLVWRAGADEELRISIAPAGRRWLRLEIRDGDAPALAVAGVRAEWRAQELVLAPAAAGAHTVYVGDPGARPPAYDLGAVLARLPAGTPVAPAALGPAGPNPRHAPRAPELPFTERYRIPLAALAVVVLAGLAFWAVRLLRRVTPPS